MRRPFDSRAGSIGLVGLQRQLELQHGLVDEVRHRDRQQRDLVLDRMIRQCSAYQAIGDLGEGQRAADRERASLRAGHGAHAGEANPDGDGATRTLLGAQSAGNAIGEVPQHRADQLRRRIASTECRLSTDGAGTTSGMHPTLVVVGGKRADLRTEGATEQRLQRTVGDAAN